MDIHGLALVLASSPFGHSSGKASPFGRLPETTSATGMLPSLCLIQQGFSRFFTFSSLPKKSIFSSVPPKQLRLRKNLNKAVYSSRARFNYSFCHPSRSTSITHAFCRHGRYRLGNIWQSRRTNLFAPFWTNCYRQNATTQKI